MRILFICEFFPSRDLKFSGGVEARTFFVAKNLARNNKVAIVASRTVSTRRIEKMFNFTVYRIGPQRKYQATVGNLMERIKFIKDAIIFAKSLDVDIIEGSNFLSHFITAIVARIKKIPKVAWYPDVWLGSWVRNAGILGIFGEILERINLFLKFDAYIVISKVVAQKLKKYVKKQINIIPCGVDVKEFKITSKKFNPPTIICISRLVRYKRIEDLIWAFALLSKKMVIDLIIVGQGPDEKRLKAIVKMLKLKNKISFNNNLSRKDLVKILKSSQLFCLPSQIEGFGISVIESAAAGVPYVVSDIPVFKEVTSNSQGGLIFKLGNVTDLVSKIEKLLTDKVLYTKKYKEAISLAKNYPWSDIAKKTEEVYLNLIKNQQL